MPQRSTEAYEVLRAQALRLEDHPNSDSGRVVLMRQGMAVWIKRAEDHNLASLPKQKSAVVISKASLPQMVEEVVGLMAEIIIKSERGAAHA